LPEAEAVSVDRRQMQMVWHPAPTRTTLSLRLTCRTRSK